MSVCESTKDNFRIEYLDIIRGIGIILMVIGHVGFGTFISKYIHAFNMPLFMIISGYLFNKEKNPRYMGYIKKKAKGLLIPYIWLGLFHYLVWVVVIGIPQNLDLIVYFTNLFGVNTSGEMPIAGALWFLTCLFFIELLFFWLVNSVQNKLGLTSIVLVFSISGFIISKYIRLPFAVDVSMVGLAFFYVGYLAKENSIRMYVRKVGNMNGKSTTLLLMLNTIFIFVNDYVNMRTAEYNFLVLFYFNAVVGTIVFWNICKLSTHCSNRLVFMTNSILKNIGRNSIVFLGLNQLIIFAIKEVFNIFILDSTAMILLQRIIVFILTIVILHALSVLITRTKFKFIIGR